MMQPSFAPAAVERPRKHKSRHGNRRSRPVVEESPADASASPPDEEPDHESDATPVVAFPFSSDNNTRPASLLPATEGRRVTDPDPTVEEQDDAPAPAPRAWPGSSTVRTAAPAVDGATAPPDSSLRNQMIDMFRRGLCACVGTPPYPV